MLEKYLHDKSPQIFRPRVTPDPTIQSRLEEKVREVLERDHKYIGSRLLKTALVQTKVEMS